MLEQLLLVVLADPVILLRRSGVNALLSRLGAADASAAGITRPSGEEDISEYGSAPPTLPSARGGFVRDPAHCGRVERLPVCTSFLCTRCGDAVECGRDRTSVTRVARDALTVVPSTVAGRLTHAPLPHTGGALEVLDAVVQ